MGEEKYDAESAAMIGLLKYGAGLPFHRLERLQAGPGHSPAGGHAVGDRGPDGRRPGPGAEGDDPPGGPGRGPAQRRYHHEGAGAGESHGGTGRFTTEPAATAAEPATPATASAVPATEAATSVTEPVVPTTGPAGDAPAPPNAKDGADQAEAGGARASSPRASSPRPWTTPSRCSSPGTSTRGRTCSICSSSAASSWVRPSRCATPSRATCPRSCGPSSPIAWRTAGDASWMLRGASLQECLHVLGILKLVYANDAIARDQRMSSQERLLFHQAQSGLRMAELEAWMETQIQEKEGGAQQRPGRGHRLPAQALERADPVPARARSPPGQQPLRKSAQEGDSPPQKFLFLSDRERVPMSATCS